MCVPFFIFIADNCMNESSPTRSLLCPFSIKCKIRQSYVLYVITYLVLHLNIVFHNSGTQLFCSMKSMSSLFKSEYSF